MQDQSAIGEPPDRDDVEPGRMPCLLPYWQASSYLKGRPDRDSAVAGITIPAKAIRAKVSEVRRRHRRATIAYVPALVAFVVALHGGGSALACRCEEPSDKVAFRSADSVVLGQIISAENDGIVYRVQVDEWWKEKIDLSILVHSSTTCRFDAELGKRYVIFLKRNSEGKLETAMCMGNLAENRAGKLLRFLRGTKQRKR